jgi:hypothetical protein
VQAPSLASEATKIVIPVRYVARGQVVHATSTALTADDVHVRSANPPPREVLIDFKLYFPNAAGIVSRSGIVADTFGAEFRAEFKDADDIARRRVSELLWRREVGLRPYPRFHTNLPTIVRENGQAKSEGYITNISRSGAFVRLGSLPRPGAVVELEISLPEHAGCHTVHAYVIHVAPRRGVGVQFISGGDAFGSDLDRYLEQLGR